MVTEKLNINILSLLEEKLIYIYIYIYIDR